MAFPTLALRARPFDAVRSERMIAAGRVVLALAAIDTLLAPSMAPAHEAGRFAALLGIYCIYAVLVALAVWQAIAVPGWVTVTLHLIDLLVCGTPLWMGPPLVPLFVLGFVFASLAALMRWGWLGALATAGGGLLVYGADVVSDIVRGLGPGLRGDVAHALIVLATAGTVALFALWHRWTQRDAAQLDRWHRIPHQVLGEVLEHGLRLGADLLESPRMLLVFESAVSGQALRACWYQETLTTSPVERDTVRHLVPDALADRDFLVLGAAGLTPHTHVFDGGRLAPWVGRPFNVQAINPQLFDSAVSAAVRGDRCRGRLFAVRGVSMTVDDLARAQMVAGKVAALLDRFLLSQELQAHVAAEERGRVSRELHDGVLQSLTAATGRLAAAAGAIGSDQQAAREALREATEQLADGQRELRFWVDEQKPAYATAGPDAEVGLPDRLQGLSRRVERAWGLRTAVHLSALAEGLPERLTHGLYRIAQEALVNAARHGKAENATLRVEGRPAAVWMEVTDDGNGFGNGHPPTEPAVLRARVAELGGSLKVVSEGTGVGVYVLVPLDPSLA